MSESIQAPRGTRDLLPGQTEAWLRAEAALRRVFGAYGYGEIRTPLFEATELFVRGIGEATDIVGKEMYTFSDRKGRSLTLRPEGTAGVVRAYAEHSLGSGENGEAKLYYIGPMFRYERPQAGRYRQFWQAGVEAIGFSEPQADAEVAAMLVQGLSEAGLKGLSVDVNSVGCAQCRPPYLSLLKAHLAASAAGLSPESQQRLETNPMRVLDSKDPRDSSAVESAPKTTDHLCSACAAHFAAFQEFLSAAGVPFRLNKRLVRGLDYYTRTAFEVLCGELGAQNAVAGGGRYDKLVGQLGGTDRPAVGFGIGLDRLVQLLELGGEQAGPGLDAAVIALGPAAQAPAFALASRLRAAGASVWMDLSGKRGMKNQMKAASAMRARFAVILGEDEIAKQAASVKDMDSGEQASLPLEGLAQAMMEKLK